MKLGRDEAVIAVPEGAALAAECRAALEAYATRPILRRAGVGVIYVVMGYRVGELVELADRFGVKLERLAKEQL